MSKATVAATLTCLAALLAMASPAPAQFFNQGANQTRATTSKASPSPARGRSRPGRTSVEIDLEVSAASELTADAIVKYRDARKKIQEAFAGLKLANVSVGERGLLVDKKGQMQSPYFFGGMQNNSRAKTEVQLSRKMVVKATDIRQMDEEKLLQQVSRLLDVAQDAGAKVGRQNNFNPYMYYNWAIGDRPAAAACPLRARRLRQARGRSLREGDRRRPDSGRAAGQAEPRRTRADRRGPRDQRPRRPDLHAATNEMPKKRLEVAKFQEIPVRVELMVRFDVRSEARGEREGRPMRSDSTNRRGVPRGLRRLGGLARVARLVELRPGRRGPAQARHPRDDQGRHQGARLPRLDPVRRRLVDHRRRPGVSRGDDRPGRNGPAGPRQLADPGQVFQERPGGRRVPRPLLDRLGPDHRAVAG